MSQRTTRFPLIDALKAIATQLIVLHHLAFYGPMSNVAFELAPEVFVWFSRSARMAVQIFLVIGGFLAARSLATMGNSRLEQPLSRIWQRYLRLAIPCVVALVVAVVCAIFARYGMRDDSIPAAPTLMQFLAHVFLLQDILGYESLSAGVWYVSIDFQLFALMVLMLWLTQRFSATISFKGVLGPGCILGLGAASLFFFNRQLSGDAFALYFFGAYAIGAAAYWGSISKRSGLWLLLLVAVVVAALIIDFRQRIALALCVGVLLAIASRQGWISTWPVSRMLGYLGQISYSVFLIHFPVCLIVNTLLMKLAPHSVTLNALGILLAWMLSLLSGALLFEYVEKRWQPVKKRSYAVAA